jgi:hypothetical protein
MFKDGLKVLVLLVLVVLVVLLVLLAALLVVLPLCCAFLSAPNVTFAGTSSVRVTTCSPPGAAAGFLCFWC